MQTMLQSVLNLNFQRALYLLFLYLSRANWQSKNGPSVFSLLDNEYLFIYLIFGLPNLKHPFDFKVALGQ